MAKLNLAVIFGGKSVEHEVSIITGLQVIQNSDKEKYNVIPVYIDKSGDWFTGNPLLNIVNFKNITDLKKKLHRLNSQFPKTLFFNYQIHADVVIPAMHGTYGEDGTLQGLLEMANIPFVGPGVTGSAIGMDKIMQKDVLKNNNIPVVNYVWFLREEWIADRNKVLTQLTNSLRFPMFVKPANLGSSIGISKAKNKSELEAAIELAVTFDRRVIVEQGLENIIEINCSVLGYKDVEASVCEQPVKSADLLSYEDKYLKGGKAKGMASLSRIIPAPISSSLSKKIQETAKKVFTVLDAAGVARIDFLVNKKNGKFYVCEINTLPGSFSFYLWEKSGYPFPKLIDKLVELAFERHQDRANTNFSFTSNLLQSFNNRSAKT